MSLFNIKVEDSEIVRGVNFLNSFWLKLKFNYFGGMKKLLKERNADLEQETKHQKEKLDEYENKVRGLERTVSEKTNQSLKDKEMSLHAQETLNLYESEIKDRDLQIKDLIERASENYDPLPRLLSNYTKPELEGILNYLGVKQSDKQPQDKITKHTTEHHATMSYFEFIKRISRNKYVVEVSSEKKNFRMDKTRVLGIIDDCIHILYCEDSFGRALKVYTTTDKEFENRIIAEMLKR